MALLQCCFESAEYVELLHTHDPVDEHEAESGDTECSKHETQRPPRDLAGIFCAIFVVSTSALLGGLFGLQMWRLLRSQTGEWCEEAPHFMDLGLHAVHLGRAMHSGFCNGLRTSAGAEFGFAGTVAVLMGPLALRLTFGKSYFTSWSEAEELQELQRLYCERSSGTSLVLHSWRVRVAVLFIFDIVIWMWLRYYLDLYLDVQAMQIFVRTEQYAFFWCNLLGIVLGLFWTAVEFYKALRETDAPGWTTLPGEQVLLVGLCLPLAGFHMTYLSILSLILGCKHRFLYISALAEAILESAVSAFVQTYAVVFSKLSFSDKMDLYSSIALSFVSIGFAFSSLDKMDGGELLVHLPGFCRSSSARWWVVFLFRVSEVASRATSLALFQRVWRPYGLFTVVATDSAIVAAVSAIFQYHRGRFTGRSKIELLRSNLIYTMPSMICLMTPMLEKDTPLTVPPGFYYSLRILELGVMGVLMSWKLDWKFEAAELLFQDDGLIVATFTLSTLVMVILGIYLRNWLAVRVLLEAPMEIWFERPFNVTQQALRNRILLGGGSTIKLAQFGLHELDRIMTRIGASTHRRSHEVRSYLAEEGSECARTATHLEWDALFLSAKVSLCVERSLKSLDEAFMKRRAAAGELVALPSQSLSNTKIAGSFLGKSSGQRGDVMMGSLACLGGKAGSLTASNRQILMQWPHDKADQKFVIEPAYEVPLGEAAVSGSCVRLRALESGYFVAVNTAAEGAAELQMRSLESDVEDPAAIFTLLLTHEEDFRSARAFARRLELAEDGLMINKLSLASKSSTEWSPYGWRIVSINDKTATREMVADIMNRGKCEKEGESMSQMGFSQVSREVSDEISGHQSMSRGESCCGDATPHTPNTPKGTYRVRFEKVFGKDMKIRFGDKIVLRTAGAWGAPGAPVSLEQVGSQPASQRLCVRAGAPAATLVLEEAEIGSRDESRLYRWVAGEIHSRIAAMELRSSLPEKLKNAIVVAYNARTDLPGLGVLFQNRGLHLNMLRLLAGLLCGYREIEIQYDSRDEIFEELRFSGDPDRPLVVEAIDAQGSTMLPGEDSQLTSGSSWMDGRAAAAGVRAGDKLVELEVDREVLQGRLLRGPADMREALGIGSMEDATRSAAIAGEPLALVFRTPCPVDSGAQEVAVGHSQMIAQLLPGWEEIVRLQKDRKNTSAEDVGLFRHNEMFRLKCTLVTSMLRCGWELGHAAFADDAISLHGHFDALTLSQLEMFLPGKEAQQRQLRERLMVAQLDVLTAAWVAIPRTVKEHRPEVLRKLFRFDRELPAMLDGLRIVHAGWKANTQGGVAIVEMPPELQHFVERVRPVNEIGMQGVLGSTAWIMKAWSGSEHKDAHGEVHRIIADFTEIHQQTEKYWLDMLKDSAETMEETQANLERALAAADVRVVLVQPENALKELGQLQQILTEDHLVLKVPFKPASDSDVVPTGHRLIRRGHVMQHFGGDVFDNEIHRRLAELARVVDEEGGDLRLLFSGDDYNSSRESASRAIEELGAIIRVVKNSAKAFPETVLPQSRILFDKHHHGEIRAVTLENRRRIQVQEREAQEMVRTANMRLSVAEAQKGTAQRKLREAEEEKVMAEVAKVDAQNQAQKVLQLYETLQHAKERLETEKTELQNDQLGWMKTRTAMEEEQKRLQGEKEELQNEKKEWTSARHAMEQEQKVLQDDIARAKGDRKGLEDKVAHLKEIQTILQSATGMQPARNVAGALEVPLPASRPNPKSLSKAKTVNFSQESLESGFEAQSTPAPAQEQEAPVLLQLWAVMSKAFAGDKTDAAGVLKSRPSSAEPGVSRARSRNSLGGA